MSSQQALMDLLKEVYLPLYQALPYREFAHITLLLAGLAVLATCLNLKGGWRVIVALLAVYLLVGAWMVPHLRGLGF